MKGRVEGGDATTTAVVVYMISSGSAMMPSQTRAALRKP